MSADEKPTLKILYQDEYFVAVDKPAGLLVHRSAIDKHETLFLLQLLRDQIGCHIFPVHRLDKPTSGAIIFAKSPSAAALLQEELNAERTIGNVKKEYLLVCRGFCAEQGVVDHPLKPIHDFKKKNNAVVTEKPVQTAVTEYQRLHTIELASAIDKYPTSRYSLVKANLITGRKHQLRRHFKHLSHPIIGCPKYGKSTHNQYFASTLGVSRLLLHAYRLCFFHPMLSKSVEIHAPLSGEFAHLLSSFHWPLMELNGD